MSSLKICDLPGHRDLDHSAMSAVVGGRSLVGSRPNVTELGAFANVNVEVNQNIAQFQAIEVNALNNVGVIGAGFGPLRLDVSPKQMARIGAAL